MAMFSAQIIYPGIIILKRSSLFQIFMKHNGVQTIYTTYQVQLRTGNLLLIVMLNAHYSGIIIFKH